MDPIFLPYSPTNGVPQESKLATYMQARNTSTPTHGIASTMAKVGLDSSPISLKKVTPQSPEFIPTQRIANNSASFFSSFGSPSGSRTSWGARGDSPHSTGVSPRITPQHSPPPETSQPVNTNIHQENVGGTTYFYPPSANTTDSINGSYSTSAFINSTFSTSASSFMNSSAPFTVYPGPASHVASMAPRTALSAAFFMPEELRQEIIHKQDLRVVDTHGIEVPQEVDNYHSLVPLEPAAAIISLKAALPASTYRAINSTTGVRYCLRRLHGVRLTSSKCMMVVDMWKKVEHSNIVQLREVCTTKAFGDNSMIFVYDYHPGSTTLLNKYFSPPISDQNGYTDPFPGDARPYSHKPPILRPAQSGTNLMLPEAEIWAIVMQLTAALRAIHSAGLACRTLDPTKILITGKRVRLSGLGITDVVSFDPSIQNPLALASHYQQDDLTALGKLVLALACSTLNAIHRDQIQSSLEIVARVYSGDLRNLILYLLASQQRRNVTDLMPMIGARFYTQLDAVQTRSDALEDHLAREMENGRLYRLLVKLGTVNERPELNLDNTWSETGNRYMLKLFRDFLFHSVTEDGRPWLDQAHIITSLNKLDSGVNEKVQLMSRDEQSVLVVTYAELKHCLEQAFEEVLMAMT